MNPQMVWWLENDPAGRRLQRRMLPESALLPRAKRDAQDERELEERQARDRRERTRKPHG
jgi:hypothetical protein